MKERHIIFLPQMGANDEFAEIVEWYKKVEEWVGKGDILCSVETSKAVYEIHADHEGYLAPLSTAGDDVKVGAPVAVISNEIENMAEIREWVEGEIQIEKAPVQDPQFTKKALILAKRLGVDLSKIPAGNEKITEAHIRDFAEKGPDVKRTALDLVEDIYLRNTTEKLLIIGAGDACVQLLDALCSIPQQKAVMILDDNPAIQGKSVSGVPIVGPVSLEDAIELKQSGKFDAAIISSGNIAFREKVFTEWEKAGIPFANVIHPTVFIGRNASVGIGNVIMAFGHIASCATIGNNNFLSAYTNAEHHSIIGSHCSFGPGIFTSGAVKIGDHVKLGTGVFIEPYISVGSDSIIASGAIIVNHIPPNSIVKSKPNYFIKERNRTAK